MLEQRGLPVPALASRPEVLFPDLFDGYIQLRRTSEPKLAVPLSEITLWFDLIGLEDAEDRQLVAEVFAGLDLVFDEWLRSQNANSPSNHRRKKGKAGT